jgi:hypothetical protein
MKSLNRRLFPRAPENYAIIQELKNPVQNEPKEHQCHDGRKSIGDLKLEIELLDKNAHALRCTNELGDDGTDQS